MRVIYDLTHFKPLSKRPVVALGVFDGLHLGHQKIIVNLLREAKRLKTLSLIVTFFPHPQKESSLFSLLHRLKLLEEAGVDLCLVIRFSRSFSRITASQFLQRILIKKINPAVVLVGKNFTFGKYAQGNWQMLKVCSKKAKFQLKVINVLTYKNIPISSSYIRALIKSGKLTQAEKLLGRPVIIFGKVIRGYRFGRNLGYPTANINPDHEIIPPSGVYAVRLRIGVKFFNGICYIGSRPTINPIRTPHLSTAARRFVAKRCGANGVKRTAGKINIEVHIFDFKDNLYERRIQIEFIGKIRNEKRFSSTQTLARQIKRDILTCHNKFGL